ncbi:MAG: preprotein translocase subunit SecE [Chiayiivirga sp.]|jgi:preprotein translocase subunit SecE|uniref:preprotein translocase subunit SecE n=1 Tax=Chiayiivirga sp. TaxID=2041042 RepID=UPI0025C179A4|nr:preprotein translocase subunit SecE [Chiayiivirga sp.]MCI1710411.1 preprotein translocase subunit SecE [Chiayiivirga sp.]MCI1728778.1 preprotein translocase subunit SecE [Chiayiivirga sp.]MCI1730806.1 preprotein translocase subunit SecE [Chiayiivirga sp.]
MNTKVEQSSASAPGDIAKYALAVVLAMAGIVAFYWFADWPGALRALLPLGGLIAAGAVFALSAKGRATIEYLGEARFELRKVIWPSRQETIRGTGVILVVVVLMSLMLGLIDFILGGGVKLLLGS